MNYRVETQGNAPPKDSLLGVEFSFCMPGCNGPVCHYEFPETGTTRHGLGSTGVTDNLTRFSATDGYGGLRLVFYRLAPGYLVAVSGRDCFFIRGRVRKDISRLKRGLRASRYCGAGSSS